MNPGKIILIYSFALLSACASQMAITPGEAAARLAKESQPGSQMPLIIEVPSANNGLSNGLIVASLSSGTDSNASRAIRMELESGKSVGVISKSKTIVCATLNRALQDMKPVSTKKIGVTVFGNNKTCSSIKKLAASKGLSFNVIAYP